MGAVKLLIAGLMLVGVSQGVYNVPNFGNFEFPQVSFIPGLPLPQPPALPPGFPTPPPLPPAPPLMVINPYQTVKIPPLTTANDIENTNPLPGHTYNGVFVSSSISGGEGQASIFVNNNGEKFYKTFTTKPKQ